MSSNQSPQPPRLINLFLDRWARRADIEDLRGDLEEEFLYNVAQKGALRAKLIFTKQVFSLCFSYALRKRKAAAAYSSHLNSGNSFAMFNNYFKIAMRNFMKQKLFTTINIVGLALGMSICLLALSISVSIFQSDNFQEKKDRIFQINTHLKSSQDVRAYGSTYPAVGDYMKEKYPIVETALTISTGFSPQIKHHGNILDFQGYFVDPEFFKVFSFKLLKGNPATALASPNTIVLTESVAEKLFRDKDPMGKVLETEAGNFTVTGVMPDPKQTHLYFKVLTSRLTYEQHQSTDHFLSEWKENRGHYLYVLLRPNTDRQALINALAQTSTKATEYHPHKTIQLQSVNLAQVVPRWNISNAIGTGWDYPTLLFFLFIGLLILLPAIFNYTNLSIARAIKRAKEIGIRKVVGAEKRQVKMQFIVETVLMTLMALCGSMFIFVIIRKEFLDMVVAAEVLDTSIRPLLLAVFIIFGLIIGVMAGIFPALYFSRLNPLHTLKGDMRNGKVSVSGVKKGLFVFQFGLSLFFIIGIATIARQYQHVFSHNHGFDSEQILTIALNQQNKQVALQELAAHPDVRAITTTSELPGINISGSVEITPNGTDTLKIREVFIGDDFVQNMKMKLKWGNTSTLASSNHNEETVLVNEQFLKSMAVFEKSKDTLAFTLANGKNARIVGVLKNLTYETLSQQIQPMMFRYSIEKAQYALLSLHSKELHTTLNELEGIWRSIDQDVPFQVSFLDDEIARAYRFLRIQIKIFSFLGALAVTIACLGLLGMVSYTTENRTKEIAIRKIMGASVSSIYLLLTIDFIKLIGFSALLAIPLSYIFYDQLFLHMLLRYGLGLGVLEVIGSVVFLFVIGFAFIYWQTSKVAQANPATNLRYE